MRIVVVEDERDIADGLVSVLRKDAYDVHWAVSRSEALHAAAEAPVDLLVVDVMLTDGEDAGFDLAADLRASGYAGRILFMTARDAVADRIRGLDLGGDDYLVKPFSLQELRARVRALLRRDTKVNTTRLVRGPLELDLAARRVGWRGSEVNLSEREFALLELLAHHPDRTFGANELLDRLFPDAGSGAAVVRVYVRQLRTKIADDVITTGSGGYRLGVP